LQAVEEEPKQHRTQKNNVAEGVSIYVGVGVAAPSSSFFSGECPFRACFVFGNYLELCFSPRLPPFGPFATLELQWL